jgi:hypothetical protein
MNEPTKDQKIGTVIIMTIAVLVVAFLIFTNSDKALKSAAQGDLAGGLGYITGAALFYSVIGWLVTYAILIPVQKQSSVWGGRVFFPILFGGVLAINFAILGGLELYARTDDSIALNRELNGFQQQIGDQSDKFQTELQALGYPEFLHPASLGAPGGLDRAQTKIAKARTILKSFHDRDRAMIGEIRRKIVSLPVSQGAKDKALADFNAGLKTTYANGERVWVLLDAMMTEQGAMLDDLAKIEGHWKTDADKIVFQHQSDLDRFNRHEQAVQQSANEIVAISNRLKAQRESARQPASP